ncbi:MAG: GNAT family N-acetyltransferase [Prolixibacteraceae bacterium]|nr:GNAT family N-acetyltransferase [Prolixibacteraceae bacterium]
MNYEIRIRALEPEDYKITINWRKEDALWDNFIGAQRYVSSDTEKRWIENAIIEHEKGIRYRFAIILKDTNILVGLFTISNLDFVNKNCETSIIIDSKYRNSNIFFSAHDLVLNYAFHQLNMKRINARVIANNKASLIACQMYGFKKEGISRKAVYKNGNYVDVIFLGLLKEEFKKV